MAEGYGGTGLTQEEKEQYFDDQSSHQWGSALETGGSYASLGATIGSGGGPVGAAIGAGVGFLVGAAVGAFTAGDVDEGRLQRIQAEKKARLKAEDAAIAEASAADTARKGGGGPRIQALPPAPSDESVLMGSMPSTGGMRMPMDPYRKTVMNKFGWS